jgi:hypothetical protein
MIRKKLLTAAAVTALSLVGLSVPAAAAPTGAAVAPSSGALKPPSVMEREGHVFRRATLPSSAAKSGRLGGRVNKGMPPVAGKGGVSALADPACVPSSCYLYNGGRQNVDATLGTGTPAATTHRGVIATSRCGGHSGQLHGATDYHSLCEVAVHGGNASYNNIVEVGATVDPNLNGDYKLTLFVFSWVNGTAGCYNLCATGGFVPIAGATYVPGVYEFTDGQTVDMTILHDVTNCGGNQCGAWWIGVGTEWVGYYPDSRWTGASTPQTFTTAGYVQLFGEISSTEERPCSDMGRGYIASNVDAARYSNVRYYTAGGALTTTGVNFNTYRTPSVEAGAPYGNTYGEGPAGNQRAFRFGGPMWNDAGTGVGIRGHVGSSCG